MFVVPSIAVLLTFVYWRPHEIFEALRPLTLNLVMGLVAFGYVLDARLGVTRPRSSPLLVVLGILFVWCLVTVGLRAPERLTEQLALIGISLACFLIVSQGLQSLRAVEAAAAIMLAFTIAVSALGVQQGLSPSVCYVRGAKAQDTGVNDVLDGRPCQSRLECEEGASRPDVDWLCERPGLMGTHSIGGRVRFRGLLEDPNELSWAIAMGTPLAFAFYERRRSKLRFALLAVTLLLGGTCVIFARSRSGQLAMMGMMGVYFIRRFGWRGALAAMVAGAPLLLLGGRSGAEAESSSEERLECWSAGLSMWRENPFVGVGAGQFGEHHYLTAHNSFILTLAELGPIGLVLWSGALYVAIKMTLRAQIELAPLPEAAAVRTWATALMASLVGMVISAFFLSLAYHSILWIFLGLAAALYGAVRVHLPEFRVRFALRDLVLLCTGDLALVGVTALYLRIKGV